MRSLYHMFICCAAPAAPAAPRERLNYITFMPPVSTPEAARETAQRAIFATPPRNLRLSNPGLLEPSARQNYPYSVYSRVTNYILSYRDTSVQTFILYHSKVPKIERDSSYLRKTYVIFLEPPVPKQFQVSSKLHAGRTS